MRKKELETVLEATQRNSVARFCENKKLEEQIEKMKNCENCKHGLKSSRGCIMELHKEEFEEPCNVCEKYDKWDMKQ